jgi:hypothetical protein
MAFIDKKDPVVLNIKLTSKGRELLSEGNMNFNYYAIGDSEVDYVFNAEVKIFNPDFSPFFSRILRPADKNPSLLSFIPRNLSGDPYNVIGNVPSVPTIIQNTAPPLGFFTISTGSTKFITDTDHVKQPDAMVKISGVTGGTFLHLYQAPTYLGNVNEPTIGDLLLIKWTNPHSKSTTGYTVSGGTPTPYLVYQIQDVQGTLASNNVIVEVDRPLPNFTQITGGSANVVAGAMIYYNYINFTGATIFNQFSTDYENEAVLAFLQNCQCPTVTFPFWNMSIVFTEELIGVQLSGRTFAQYNSIVYGGFVSYIQNQAPVIKKMGIIHYTNSSPSNTYGEELYQNTPVLNLPTIMWHKSPTNKMGVTFSAYGPVQTLTGKTSSLNTDYYDLADSLGNIVGKIFNDLEIFVIEDPELLFAMSYKSNRSWTLPNYTIGINDNVIIGCQTNEITFMLSGLSPTTIGGNNGKLKIYNISGYTTPANMVLEVLSGSTSGITIFYGKQTTGSHILTGLKAGTYYVNVYDLGTVNITPATGSTIISNPSSILSFTSPPIVSSSGLDPHFKITQISPSSVRIYQTDIGSIYGGTTANNPAAGIRTYGAPTGSTVWHPFVGGQVNLNMTFTQSYTISVRDSGATFNFIDSQDYVAVGSALNSNFSTSQGLNFNVSVSNYLVALNPGVNPIISGTVIEVSIYPAAGVPLTWVTANVNNIPVTVTASSAGSFIIAVRERKGAIVMYTVTKPITIH